MAAVTSQIELVRQVLESYAASARPSRPDGVETLLYYDPVLQAWQLRRLGWNKDRRVNSSLIQARIKHGKVIIEENNTEWNVADDLWKAGIPLEEIELGFVPPALRRPLVLQVA